MIDLHEYSDRSETAMAAKTRGELNAVLADLPGMVHAAGPSAVRREVLTANARTIKRDGAWTPPPQLFLHANCGTVILDFREARVDYARLYLELDAKLSAVRLRLPEQASVNSEGLDGQVVGKRTKVATAEEPGNPHFVLAGRLLLCQVYVHRGGKRR